MKKTKEEDIKPEEEVVMEEKETKSEGKKERKEKKAKKLSVKEELEAKNEDLRQELGEVKDKYLRLAAEFDNFKRRSARERIDLMKTAGQDLIVDLLPVIDDFDRAEKAKNEDLSLKVESYSLIRNKLFKSLENKGLKCMEAKDENFNPEFHEAITEIPAPNDELKGKVVDVVEEGYYLNDKIIRYAKVVVGK